MISTQSRSKDWIMGIRGTSRIPTDPILIEKMILALTLLENMSTSGLEFIFKGGTSMLLVMGTPMRFSIDLDIVMETDRGLEEALQSILQ
jgi:predicted nucleotidyltransferase component of viral defense system